MTDSQFRRQWLGLAAGAALVVSSAAAFAQDGSPIDRHAALMEMQTAQYYAGDAVKAKTLDDVQKSLRRARLCLTGTQTAQADTAATVSCGVQGSGAIPDAQDPQRRALAQNALTKIDEGLQASDLSAAQNAARLAIRTLRTAVL